jgi:hypothetical protein
MLSEDFIEIKEYIYHDSGIEKHFGKRKHVIIRQIEILFFFCEKNKMDPNCEMFGNLLNATYRLSREMENPFDIDYELLQYIYVDIEKNWFKEKESYYNNLFYVCDVLEVVSNSYFEMEYLKNTRKVLFEKTWKYYVG